MMNIVVLSRVLGSLSLAAFVGLVGCSSSSGDGSELTDDELRVKPTGSENWATLTMQLPTGTCQAGLSCSRPLGSNVSMLVDGQAATIGQKFRLKPGSHVVAVNGTTTTVPLKGGENRTLTLAVARRKCQAAALPSVAQTDFGRSIELANAACPSQLANTTATKPVVTLHWYNWNCPAGNVTGTLSQTPIDCNALRTDRAYSISVGGVCVNLDAQHGYPQGNGIDPREACTRYNAGDVSWVPSLGASFQDYDQAYVPGDYSPVVTSGVSVSPFTLQEGDIKEIAISLGVLGAIPPTFATNISFTDPRELPDGAATQITSNCSGDRNYTVAAGATTTLKLKAFQNSGCAYTLKAGGRSITLDQGATNSIKLGRLDVDDPVVTREDGSTYSTRGTFELYFGGNLVYGAVQTNTGVDMLPGTYELVTKFSTVDGAQVQRQTIKF